VQQACRRVPGTQIAGWRPANVGVPPLKTVLAVLLLGLLWPLAGHTASGEVAKADAERKKPLQRCDQMKGDAQLGCLKKAREHIVDARNKRESSAKTEESKLNQKTVERDTTPQKGK
jgi:hypothetical protein